MFKFSDLTAKQVMIPRTDMMCIDMDTNFEELNNITIENQYTRYPVYEDNNIDKILGFVHVKDLYALTVKGADNSVSLKDLLRIICFNSI